MISRLEHSLTSTSDFYGSTYYHHFPDNNSAAVSIYKQILRLNRFYPVTAFVFSIFCFASHFS